MENLTRLLPIFAIFAMLFFAFGCVGGDETGGSDTLPSSETDASKTDPNIEQDKDPKPVIKKEPVIVGNITDYTARQFTTSDGLDSNKVTCFSESDRVYITTDGSVMSLDGVDLKREDISDMLELAEEKKDENVFARHENLTLHCFAKDSKANRWLLSNSGITYDSAEGLKHEKSPESFADHLFIDNSDQVWLVSYHSIRPIARSTDGEWIQEAKKGGALEEYDWVNFLGYDRFEDIVYVKARVEVSDDPIIYAFSKGSWEKIEDFDMGSAFATSQDAYISHGSWASLTQTDKTDTSSKYILSSWHDSDGHEKVFGDLLTEISAFDKIFIDSHANIYLNGIKNDYEPIGLVMLSKES